MLCIFELLLARNCRARIVFCVFWKSLIMSAGKTLSVLVNVVLWLQNNNNNNYKMKNLTQPSTHNNSTMIHLFNDSTFHATSEPPAGSVWYYVFLFLSLINTICHGMGVWLLTSTYKDRKVIKNSNQPFSGIR